MIQTTLNLVPEAGELIVYDAYPRYAQQIWRIIFKDYYPEYAATESARARWRGFASEQYRTYAYFSLDTQNMIDLWDIFRNPKLPETIGIMMACTFDHVMVKAVQLNRIAYAFQDFVGAYGDDLSPRTVTTLQQQIEAMAEIAKKQVHAICWTQSSIASDVWQVYEDGDVRGYDLSKDDDRHFFLFDGESYDAPIIDLPVQPYQSPKEPSTPLKWRPITYDQGGAPKVRLSQRVKVVSTQEEGIILAWTMKDGKFKFKIVLDKNREAFNSLPDGVYGEYKRYSADELLVAE